MNAGQWPRNLRLLKLCCSDALRAAPLGRRLRLLVYATLLLTAADAPATQPQLGEATGTLIRDGNLEEKVPGGRRIGIAPGDVLLRNDFLSAVILTGARDSKSMRVGQCVLLDGTFDGSREPLVIGPGPRGLWDRANIGRTGGAIVVRFRHEEQDWSAELIYRIDGDKPWLEMETRIQNRSKDRLLEVPLVDDLKTPAKSKVADDQMEGITIARHNPAGIVAISGSDRRAYVRESDDDRWFVVYDSEDPSLSVLRRMKPRLLPLSKSGDILQPVTVERDWTRFVRDRDRWFRLEPETERIVLRRVFFAPNLTDAKSLAAFARGIDGESGKIAATRPGGRPDRQPTQATSSAKPPAPTEAAKPRRIVGTLRPNASAPPATRPKSASSEPQKAEPPKWESVSKGNSGSRSTRESEKPAAAPKAIGAPKSILEIPNLPPPIDGAD